MDNEKDWRDDVSDEAPTAFKVLDGETKILTFKDTGEKKTHPDFGVSIVFKVVEDGESESENWYLNPDNPIVREIKQLGDILNLKIEVSRVGSKRSDTRYTIKTL